MIRKGVYLLFFLLLAGVASIYWGSIELDKYLNAPIKSEGNQFITVPKGANYYSLTRQFVATDLITTSPWAGLAVKIYPALSKIKAGTYQIKPGMSLKEVFTLIGEGKEHQFSITFVEGNTFAFWREQLATTPFIAQEMASMSEAKIAAAVGLERVTLEGLLLPETYYFVAGDSDLSILKRASNALKIVLNEAWEGRAKDLPIKTQYDLLTFASIIEKETALDTERAKVASVFVNRLNKRMRLQTDPTVIYGMGDAYKGDIHKKDLRAPTPYNTYVIFGLPPTPIAMPSKASIFAAALPANTPYYYFVADGLGGHQFSITLTEHNRAVKQYLKMLKIK